VTPAVEPDTPACGCLPDLGHRQQVTGPCSSTANQRPGGRQHTSRWQERTRPPQLRGSWTSTRTRRQTVSRPASGAM
jgi:hypothetical protein